MRNTKGCLTIVALPFVVVVLIYQAIYLSFRKLWKSNLDIRLKWGITGAVALLVIIPILTSRAPEDTTQTAQALSAQASASEQAVVPAGTATPSAAAIPTIAPTATPAPTLPPTAAPVAATKAPAPLATKAPVPPPAPPAFSYCGAPANPWHYNFCGGSVISNPPSSICNYFNCIASFWHEDIPNDGYVIQCVDGTFSLSGGEAGGVCGSGHGGPSRTLYAP